MKIKTKTWNFEDLARASMSLGTLIFDNKEMPSIFIGKENLDFWNSKKDIVKGIIADKTLVNDYDEKVKLF